MVKNLFYREKFWDLPQIFHDFFSENLESYFFCLKIKKLLDICALS